jgi:deoxyribodipyrimidine photolyase-related protein
VLANLRHFCLEQAARGVAVRHVATDGGYADALAAVARELGPLRAVEPAERELRAELAPLVRDGALELVPHDGWMTTADDFRASHPGGPPWRMDRFYRHVRRATGILMQDGKPVGGKFSFDADNRKPWRGEPPAPVAPRYRPDAVTDEVLALVERTFARHPGELDGGALPTTRQHARRMLRFALDRCLPRFGPFQDAMSSVEPGLFHTRLSPLLNVCRLLPAEVVAAAAEADLPSASQEGFVRQVLGWREFVRHVHLATDGFRALPGRPRARGTARPSFLDAHEPLPQAFWGAPSGMACLDTVVRSVWQDGYGHHTTRLMVLANLATLLDVEPRELCDWFHVAYTDAYDWVVEPNVLGMGTFAAGDVMTTKPYVAGSAYIDKMSDYCRGCAFDPRRDCPVRSLYWAFLARHEARLRDNPRLSMGLRSLARRSKSQREGDERVFERVSARMRDGRTLAET